MGSEPGCASTYALFLVTLVALVTAPRAQAAEEAVCHSPECPIQRSYKQSQWNVVETKNFHVCCDESKSHAETLARHAEGLLSELRQKWLGSSTQDAWSPKCDIYLHKNRASYASAVGRGAGQTVGSSLIRNDGPHVVTRRLDLVGRSDFLSAALPHELTHIVLKDRFVETSLPRWADEGSAILADTDDKQDRHRLDFQHGIAAGNTFRAIELLTLEEYPTREKFGVFYGQSASLTEYLVRRKTPAVFLTFIEKASSSGYDSALSDVYGIKNVGELERLWQQRVVAIPD